MSDGKYKILKKLGSGTTGNVYLVEQETKNGEKKRLVLKQGKTKEDNSTLYNEADMLNYIKPFCDDEFVCLDHIELNNENIDIFMEYLPDYIEMLEYITTNPLTPDQFPLIYEIAKNSILALLKLHSKNVIEFDIKPENILVNVRTGKIKLIDFGFSCRGKYCTIKRYGTYDYIAPELLFESFVSGIYPERKINIEDLISKSEIKEEEEDEDLRRTERITSTLKRTDIWSLGVTLFVLLAGNFIYDFPYIKRYTNYPMLAQDDPERFVKIKLMWNEDFITLHDHFENIPVAKMLQPVEHAKKFKEAYPVQYEDLVHSITQMLALMPEKRKLIPLQPFDVPYSGHVRKEGSRVGNENGIFKRRDTFLPIMS